MRGGAQHCTFCPDGIYPSARQPVAQPRLDNKVYEHCKVEGFAMYVEPNQPRQTNNGGRRVSLGRRSLTSEAGPTGRDLPQHFVQEQQQHLKGQGDCWPGQTEQEQQGGP